MVPKPRENANRAATGRVRSEFPEGIALAAYEQLSARYHAVNTMKQQAASGNPLAQYSLGRLYDKGQGVPQDYAEAHFWYALAIGQLDGPDLERAMKSQDEILSHLTPADLSRELERVLEWLKAHEAHPSKPQ